MEPSSNRISQHTVSTTAAPISATTAAAAFGASQLMNNGNTASNRINEHTDSPTSEVLSVMTVALVAAAAFGTSQLVRQSITPHSRMTANDLVQQEAVSTQAHGKTRRA
jgi:hypothetical protein